MWHGHPPEGQSQGRAGARGLTKTIRTTNHEADTRHTRIAPFPKGSGKTGTVERGAGFIESDEPERIGALREDGGSLLGLAIKVAPRLTFSQLDETRRLEPDGTPAPFQPFGIARDKLALRPGLQPADRDDVELHAASFRLGARAHRARLGLFFRYAFAGPPHAPELFEIVEAPDFRPEKMDDDIASIDQDPIADRHAFDARRGQPHFLERLRNALGNRADMAIRPAGSDQHPIGQRGLASKIEGGDVFGLGIIQNGCESRNKRTDGGSGSSGIGDGRVFRALGR